MFALPKLPVLAVTLAASSVLAGPPLMKFQSAGSRAALLELYTSEGCSSCPPAEKWLSGLKDSPGLWRDFVPLAFHVDYWDYLGWRDSWAKTDFSDRQRAYAAAWHSHSVYTPGFVLNGQEWRAGAGQRTVPKAGPDSPGLLQVASLKKDFWHVRFVPATPVTGKIEVHAAILVCGVSSKVTAGENRGRRLWHDFVVMKLVDAPLAAANGESTGNFALPTPAVAANARLAMAAWVTENGRFEPFQATGGWFADGQ